MLDPRSLAFAAFVSLACGTVERTEVTPQQQPPEDPSPQDPLPSWTGDCTAASNGARRGLPLPAEGDTWLRDPDPTLAREYWRVFVRASGTAYILPDPKLPPQYYVPACADLADPLFEIVMRYAFCEPQGSWDTMTPADALSVAHSYHEHLLFDFYSPGIVPTPILSDVVDACELGNVDDSAGFEVLCDYARQVCAREDGSTIPNQFWEGQAGADLAYHLNQLYGIAGSRRTLAISPELCGLPSDTAGCSTPGPRYFYDPRTAACELRAFGSCGTSVADFPTAETCNGACIMRAHGCAHCEAGSCSAGTDCSTCPTTTPDTGAACNELGFQCAYGSGCSWAHCTCESDASGRAAWACIFTAC